MQSEPSPQIVEEAANWAAILDSGEMDENERNAFETWCSMDPLHLHTLERMWAFDKHVADSDDFERDALQRVLKRRRYPQAMGTLLGLALIVCAGWAGVRSHYIQDIFPDYQTKPGETRTIMLHDGSEILFEPDAAANVYMDGKRREIRLIRGQILAKVASGQPLPFVISTEHGSATALGTSYIVRRERGYTELAVVESRVRACPQKSVHSDECRIISAGEQARITSNQVFVGTGANSISGIEGNTWLEVDDREVTEILHELNRYRKRPIRFDEPALRGIKVTGSFPLHNTSRALEGIASAADISVRYGKDEEITIEARH